MIVDLHGNFDVVGVERAVFEDFLHPVGNRLYDSIFLILNVIDESVQRFEGVLEFFFIELHFAVLVVITGERNLMSLGSFKSRLHRELVLSPLKLSFYSWFVTLWEIFVA